MKSILWIGVDVSKDSFHAAYRQHRGFSQREFDMDGATIRRCVNSIGGEYPSGLI